MVSAMCSDEPYVKIGSETVPREELRQRFLELDGEQMENAYREYCKINTPIKNIRGYMLTALYNSFDTTALRIDNNANFLE